MTDLRQEFQNFLAHRDEYLKKYNGKVIVLKDGQVLGVYGSEIEAVTETAKAHERGTFLVQNVEPGDASVSQTFHSRVAFG